MSVMDSRHGNELVTKDDLVLITGANGFIGAKVVENLLDRGFRNLRCMVRPGKAPTRLEHVLDNEGASTRVQVLTGNLLSKDDCAVAAKNAALIYHLAAGRGAKSFPDAFLNSVVTTRNLLESVVEHQCVRRFVNVSSFTVYANSNKPHGRLLDEDCPLESHPELRADAYDFAKAKQDEMVAEYGKRCGIPFVIVRPGCVVGPGNLGITGRVGIGTFGVYLHLGGSNPIPFTYVDNCADAIVLVGLTPGVDGEVFNVVDDDLPSSRRFLLLYKQNVRRFHSIYVPHLFSYALCWMWEWYSMYSDRQLPPAFTRKKWHSYWKRTFYSNAKLKRLGWTPKVGMDEALSRYFAACRNGGRSA